MPTLFYQPTKDKEGNKVLVVHIPNITMAQITEIVKKEFPELGENPDQKRIGIMQQHGSFGICIINEEDQPGHIS